MIPFNIPPHIGTEEEYMIDAINNQKICGDGPYTKKCNQWFEEIFKVNKCLLTTSCTHALEISALLAGIKPGDEIIMPSYTFVSTANAFVLRGAKIVFVDIRPDTMNIDENLIEDAITAATRAIVPVHYAGVSCEMDKINDVAKKYNIFVIEDAAQGVMSTYKGKNLGTLGDFGCYSFHETKNYSMGEGGALLINNTKFLDRAEVVREKGTNRSQFFRGQVDKYSWVDIGSSYLPSDINAAHLYAELIGADKINEKRLKIWDLYYTALYELKDKIDLPYIPEECTHNAHMFYIKCKDIDERTQLIDHLKSNNIIPAFHYIPLHSSKMGITCTRFHGEDLYTTRDSERLLRLPLYYGIKENDILSICNHILNFYKDR